MGLDMWLMRNEDETEVIYWRKANQIRAWFAKHSDTFEDNGVTIFSRTDLEELIEDINIVLENPEKAEEILPTSCGFFFGSTEYDEYYFEELKRTKEVLEEELKDDYSEDYYKYSEWY